MFRYLCIFSKLYWLKSKWLYDMFYVAYSCFKFTATKRRTQNRGHFYHGVSKTFTQLRIHLDLPL